MSKDKPIVDVFADEIKELKKKRSIIKGKLSFYIKFVTSLTDLELTDLRKTELQVRTKTVESLNQQFCEVQDTIELKSSDSQLTSELDERQTFEDQYYAILAKAKCFLKEYSPCHTSNSKNSIKLPTISLPTFDGTYDNWLEFRDTFLSLIHNSKNIDNVQKLHYLRSALSGNALQVIKSLEFSAENYDIAWELLQNRYNNNRLLVHNHVKALFAAQSLSKESASSIRKLIDAFLRNIRALNALDEPTETWDTLIIFIMVSKLDSSTEREWELYKSTILKAESKSKIKFTDLIKFLKDRADVLETIKVSQNRHTPDIKVKKQSSNQSHSHSYVATQSKPSNQPSNHKRAFTCCLCNAAHALYNCTSFLNLSTQDKYKIVDEKGLCCNCLRSGHAVKDCWFGPCKQCNRKQYFIMQRRLPRIDIVGRRCARRASVAAG